MLYIHDDVHVEAARHLRIEQIQEFPKLRRAVSLMELVITSLVFALSAANSIVVPCRL